MIRCPVCGANAQWGAPMCPKCHAPFVAPPSQVPPPSVLLPQSHEPPELSSTSKWLLGGGIAGLTCLLLFMFFLQRRSHEDSGSTFTPVKNPTQSMFAVRANPPAQPVTPNGTKTPPAGMFEVKPQTAQAPVIAIRNGSWYPMRLRLEGANGAEQIVWIQEEKVREVTVAQGLYRATIDSPDNPMTQPTNGTVDVRDYHHYEADFVLVDANEGPHDFYIGD